MVRCVIGQILTILFLLVVTSHVCWSQTCPELYENATRRFYADAVASSYTCNDMLYMKHGKGCYRKCNFIAEVYDSFDNVTCTEGICSAEEVSKLSFTPLGECKTKYSNIYCNKNYPYRSIDGHCNNLKNPHWGKSNVHQQRLLKNSYDDGYNKPRVRGCAGYLPNPRNVSRIVHRGGSMMKFESKLTYMMMQVGQFLAHDMVLTKMSTGLDGDSLKCCGEDKYNSECSSITVPDGDPYFHNMTCIDAARSHARYDCSGIRQQINSQTSYIDLSAVYGADDEQAAILRTHEEGLLASRKNNLLPRDETDQTCDLSSEINETYYCPNSGDERLNEQAGLTSMHTLFMREHNRIAGLLAQYNPHWDDETLYQEARRINIAQWTNIVYQEFLPELIGPYLMKKLNLEIRPKGYKETYNPKIDATILNEFGAAIFRFGHSLIHRNISMLDFDYNDMDEAKELHSTFFDPAMYHAYNGYGMEHLLMWISQERCPMMDAHMEESVIDKLFIDDLLLSLDLAALNINRGRDHGICGYNEYRQLCGLSQVTHFGTYKGGLVDHHPSVARRLQEAYTCPSDIDLWTGMISEERGKGTILGPTAQCILAYQFKQLRDGDRFFFERPDPKIGFTKDQLNSIKKVRLSTLICLNTEAMFLQKNVFHQAPMEHGTWSTMTSMNELMSCTQHHDSAVNLELWKDGMDVHNWGK